MRRRRARVSVHEVGKGGRIEKNLVGLGVVVVSAERDELLCHKWSQIGTMAAEERVSSSLSMIRRSVKANEGERAAASSEAVSKSITCFQHLKKRNPWGRCPLRRGR